MQGGLTPKGRCTIYTDVNLEALKRCVRNTEKAPAFNLHHFTSKCGSYGCLIGNDYIACTGQSEPPEEWFTDWSLGQYGIPRVLWCFLFSEYELLRDENGISVEPYGVGELDANTDDGIPRDWFLREAALNRLRKYIAYVEMKKRIFYEADGRVRELARRQSGNWNVCANVLTSLALAT